MNWINQKTLKDYIQMRIKCEVNEDDDNDDDDVNGDEEDEIE